jgi:hypothetical protein
MAVASLSKFTVPLRTNQSASTQGLLMPKLQYRFRVTFEGFGVVGADTVELTKQVISFSRPQVSFDDIDIHVYNSRVKLAGKPNWGDITTTIRDDAGGNVSRLVGYQLQKQFDFMEQSSAAAGGDYKFNLRCEMLDGGNGNQDIQVLETWEISGAYIKDANYQEMAYERSDPVTIQLTMRFDNAVQTPGGTGIGTNVGRAMGLNVTL